MASCWINGKITDEAQATVSIRDTGLLHSAGAFTTMRAYAGKVFRFADHLERLRTTCQALFIPLPYTDEQLQTAAAELLSANALTDARLRLTVTCGALAIDPLHGPRMEPNVFITATTIEPYPAHYYQDGMTVIAYDTQKLNPYDMQAGHKTLNYFSRLAALRDARARSASEALWFNVHNYLQSGSISNLFIVRSGILLTPPTQPELDEDPSIREKTPYPHSNVLPGIARRVVIEQAQQQKIEVRIGPLTINDLLDADECFITNSIMEVMPVCRIERKAIGTDKPGLLTQKLAMLYRSAVDSYGAVE